MRGRCRQHALTGGPFGTNLDRHILDGYSHLVEEYDDGDELFILGFSRGGYPDRRLSDLALRWMQDKAPRAIAPPGRECRRAAEPPYPRTPGSSAGQALRSATSS